MVVGLIAALLLGISGGFYLDNPEPVVVPVYRYVNNTVEVEVAVEVPVEYTLLDDSLEVFLEEYEDDDDVVCATDEYDFEELTVRKVYDAYNVSYDGDDTTIDFKVKLKYDDDNDKCYKTFDVNIFYEEDESPEITY